MVDPTGKLEVIADILNSVSQATSNPNFGIIGACVAVGSQLAKPMVEDAIETYKIAKDMLSDISINPFGNVKVANGEAGREAIGNLTLAEKTALFKVYNNEWQTDDNHPLRVGDLYSHTPASRIPHGWNEAGNATPMPEHMLLDPWMIAKYISRKSPTYDAGQDAPWEAIIWTNGIGDIAGYVHDGQHRTMRDMWDTYREVQLRQLTYGLHWSFPTDLPRGHGIVPLGAVNFDRLTTTQRPNMFYWYDRGFSAPTGGWNAPIPPTPYFPASGTFRPAQ